MKEKWEITKWFIFGGVLLLIVIAIGWALMPVGKMVERKVLVESHQYKEGMADRAATLRASLAEIDSRLAYMVATETEDTQLRGDLEAQRATINVQLNAIRR